MKRSIIIFCLYLGMSTTPVRAGSGDPGLFATLQTTMGEICMELAYTSTPRTVANFVSLAEGTRTWVDFEEGRVKEDPYYFTNKIHRVASNFVIQAGSPIGDGKGGPGYVFKDEFVGWLSHSNAGVLSMANGGVPNSNGSQYFITLRPTPELDGLHSVFGYVVSGMSVVSNIGQAVTDSNQVPLVEIVITNLSILRNGAEAMAFDPNAVSPMLPVVRGKDANIGYTPPNYVVSWTLETNSTYWIFGNDDLTTTDGIFRLFSFPIPGSGIVLNSGFSSYPFLTLTVIEVEEFL